MYFTHSLVGALFVKPIIDKAEDKFTQKEKVVLWFAGITGSVLPDFDLVYTIFHGLGNHRYFATHGIFLYIILYLLLYFIGLLHERNEFGRKFFKTLALVTILGVFSHFVIDFFIGGIAIFSPFSEIIYGLSIYYDRQTHNWLFRYLTSSYMLVEFINLVVFFKVLKDKKYFFARIISLGYVVIAMFMFVLVSIIFS